MFLGRLISPAEVPARSFLLRLVAARQLKPFEKKLGTVDHCNHLSKAMSMHRSYFNAKTSFIHILPPIDVKSFAGLMLIYISKACMKPLGPKPYISTLSLPLRRTQSHRLLSTCQARWEVQAITDCMLGATLWKLVEGCFRMFHIIILSGTGRRHVCSPKE